MPFVLSLCSVCAVQIKFYIITRLNIKCFKTLRFIGLFIIFQLVDYKVILAMECKIVILITPLLVPVPLKKRQMCILVTNFV